MCNTETEVCIESIESGNYNSEWVKLPLTGEEIKDINDAYGEYEIVDLETGLSILLDGYNLSDLNALIQRIETELDEDEFETLNAYFETIDTDIDTAIGRVKDGDCHLYKGMSLSDVAYELVKEGLFGDVSDSLMNYIDYERLGTDLGYDNYYEASNGVIEYRG